MADPVATAAPVIYRLSIERFRGFKSLIWFPARGANAILGGGDVSSLLACFIGSRRSEMLVGIRPSRSSAVSGVA
jgi:hypothetical protein